MKLSVSLLHTYSICPRLYKFRYVDKIAGKNLEAIVGEVTHELLAWIQKEKITSWEEIQWRLSQVVTVLDIPPEEKTEISARVLSLLKVFYENQSQYLVGAEVEKGFLLPYKNDFLIGRFDRVESTSSSRVVVIDFKTGHFVGMSYRQLAESFQVVVYSWAAKNIFGVTDVVVRYWWLVYNKVLEFRVSPEVEKKVFKKIDRIVRRIKRGEFNPRPSGLCCRCVALSKCLKGQKYIVDNTEWLYIADPKQLTFV